MKKQIVINASQDRSRIAIVEDGELVELYVENPDNVRTIGNIYLGKVEKVMPTLRAAFVDIGEKQDAFLHFSDLTDNFPQLLKMSGEDVPGLEEPMLALAPQKRIADDESEPDVEDTLEVESAQDDDESPSRSRSTRRRRSRGRGRTSQAGSEEEEQEEQGKRPRGPLVLDFTSKPKPRAAAPEPRAKAPAPAAERPVAETPVAETPAAKAPAAEAPAATPPVADKADASETPAETPRSRRAPRKPRTAADLPPPETEDAAPETAEETKKPRRSRAKKTQDAPAETQAAEAETPPADEKSEPRSRRSRGQKAEETVEVPTETADAAAVDAAPADAETAARPRRAPRNRPTRTTTATTATTATVTAEARVAPAAETPEAAETPAEDGEREDRTRSRRRTRGAADTPEQTPEPTAEKAEKAEAPLASEPTTPEAPKRPRGMAVLDLTSGARPKPAPRPEPVRPEPVRSEPAAEADDDEAPRSRRPARSRDADAPATVSTEPTPEADETAEDRPRSRRRGRRSEEDSRPTDRDETPRAETRRDEPAADTDDDDADEAPARSRRQTRETSGRETSGRETSGKSDAGRDGRGRRDEAKPGASRAPGARRVPVPSNEQLLRRDGHVIVKITKEPISAKGSRVSTDISLAGRFLVLVPAADYVAVSKKIESAKERRRLRTLAQSLKPDNCGVIVRTVAEGRDAKSLDTDLRLLIDKWRSIEAKLDGGKAKAPILLYEDVNMVSSIVRDLFSEDFDRILVDDPKVFKNVQAYVKAVAPDMADKVELHRGSAPAFRSVGIEKQVEEAFSRRVNMKGGGYLFIETTEAMHVVDVNSGRAGRGKSQKENMIAVNVEAAREVAKQLRLRDLGGIIVVDFIDLRLEADRRKVTNVLKEAFEKDRAVTKLLPMSDFGLVQITRQRLRPSITAQPEGDEPGGDPAERAARAGAGEIEQAPGRRARGDDRRDDGRDDRPSRELDTIGEAPAETRDRAEREPRNDRNDRSDRSDRGRRSTRDTARETPRAPRDAAEERPEPAASPESATALLRAWLDAYRKAVEEPYRDRPVVVRVHPLFLTHLQRGLFSTLTRWRLSVRNIPWRIEEDAALDPLAFDVRDEKSGRSLLRKYAL